MESYSIEKMGLNFHICLRSGPTEGADPPTPLRSGAHKAFLAQKQKLAATRIVVCRHEKQDTFDVP